MKTVLITGAGRGIGRATALEAARRGYQVCVNYQRSEDAAQSLVAEIRAMGGTAIAVRGNVAVEEDVVELFRRCDAELGPLAALVNNAGTLEPQMRLDQITAARLERVFAVNVTGAFLCAREAVRRMSTRYGGAGGVIVNVSSAAARLGAPGEYIDYAASKGAIDSMTVGLAKEVAMEGIRVNAVRPGLVHTDIHALGGEPGRIDRLKGSIPMQRGGQPEEIAGAILWLLSEDASYVTGQLIDVTGGR